VRLSCVCVAIAIVQMLEEKLAEREKGYRALETALQAAKFQPAPEPAPAPPPPPAPAPAPPPPVQPEEDVHDTPIHPAASSDSLGQHLRSFCEGGTLMVSRHGLSSALRSLPDQDRAKRMEEKLLRLFDGLDDEGGYGNSPDRKLVSADSEAQLTKLIVLIAHGERKEQINFALAALTTKGAPASVTSTLAKDALGFSGAYVLDFYYVTGWLPACPVRLACLPALLPALFVCETEEDACLTPLSLVVWPSGVWSVGRSCA
jgi:hypothetical protein